MILLLACVSSSEAPVQEVDPLVNRRGWPGQEFHFQAPDGDRFHWTVDGDDYRLVGQGTDHVVFTPDAQGDYALTVEVCDELGCFTEEVFAFVRSPWTVSGNAPVSDAGADQTVALNSVVNLDGSNSYDDENDPLSAVWSFKSVPSNSSLTKSDISGRFSQTASFTPDVTGEYVVRLYVSDGTSYTTDTATVTVTNATSNTAPVSDAGPDRSAWLAYAVELDGSGTYDPDGDPLTYRWGFKTLPAGSTLTNADLTDRYTNAASFEADVVGVYTLRLVAMDGTDQDVDFVDVTVTSPSNYPPESDAGVDTIAVLGDTVTLDGTGTVDIDGDPLSYRWGFKTVPSGSSITNASWGDRYTVNGYFTPDVEGTYTAKLVVNDGTDQDIDFVDIVVVAASNNAPNANGGPDQYNQAGNQVTLDGSSSSDPDGDSLTYRWGFKSVPTGSALTNADWVDRYTTSGKFTPDVGGTYEVRFVVDDGSLTDVDFVTVTACTPTTWYSDTDGDGYGNPNISFSACTQATGTVADNTDCYDNNANANPAATGWFSTDRGDGSYDYNCDGSETAYYQANYDCNVTWYSTCDDNTDGWTSGQPACGSAGTYGTGCSAWVWSCEPDSTSQVTQTCR